MSYSKNSHKLAELSRIDTHLAGRNEDEAQRPPPPYISLPVTMTPARSSKYQAQFKFDRVTVSKKPSPSSAEDASLCSGQKSFISIHSTDQLCQSADIDNPSILEECNVEVLSLNEVFPSTSEESLSNDEETTMKKRQKARKMSPTRKVNEHLPKTAYVPSNSKSSTVSGRFTDSSDGQRSDFDVSKSTLYVVGSNPGEPKISYQDPPKKISKTMKKFLRNIDKHKSEMSKVGEKAISKLTTMRGILKDGRCVPECTGDSTAQGPEEYTELQDLRFPFQTDFCTYSAYTKQNPDKNVTFNTQVVIIHLRGDNCIGQSVEALSKEKDQQARNSELRKTFLSKYNEFWPTQK